MNPVLISETEEVLAAITPASNASFAAETIGLGQAQTDGIRAWLSSFAYHYRTNPPAGHISWACLTARLTDWGRIPLEDSSAKFPDFVRKKDGLQKRIKDALAESVSGRPIDPQAVRSAWQHLELVGNNGAPVLPDPLLESLMPAQYWPLLAGFIADGPERAAKRLNLWLHSWAKGKKTTTVESTRSSMLRYFHECSNLRDHESGIFTAWSGEKPRLIKPSGTDDTPMRPGNPELREIRLAVQRLTSELCAQVARAAGRTTVGLEEIKDVIEHLDSDMIRQSRRSPIFTLARNWLVLHSIWVIQARIESLTRLTVGDLRMRETGAGRMMTLAHRPGKTHDVHLVFEKPLSDLALYPFQVFGAIREKLVGSALPSELPLIPLSRSEQSRPLGVQGIAKILQGDVERADLARASRYPVAEFREALDRDKVAAYRAGKDPREVGYFEVKHGPWTQEVWLDTRMTSKRASAIEAGDEPIWVGVVKALLPINGNPYEGWNPHSLRKTGSQELDSPRVTEYLVKRNFTYSPEWLSEVLQTHKNLDGTTNVSAIYKAPQDVREIVAAMATEVLAELLYGKLGARLKMDVDRYSNALRTQRALDVQRESLKKRRADLSKDRRAKRVSARTYQLDTDEIMAELVECAELRAELKALIERFEGGDRSLMVPVPDELDDDHLDVDLEAVRRGVLGLADGRPLSTLNPSVRSWITTSELALVGGIPRRTASSWTRTDGTQSTPSGTSPFRTSDLPVVELSDTRRIIPAEALNPTWLDEEPNRRIVLGQLLSDWPEADSWRAYRTENHRLPDWLEGELEKAPARPGN